MRKGRGMPSQAEIEAAQKALGGAGGLGGMNLPAGLSGFGKK